MLCRHEEQQHGQKLVDDEIPQEKAQADYKFNYHSAKLAFGLVLFEFNDGDRLFDLYKLALLLYKTHGHYTYAYAVLMHLVKALIAILPPCQGLQMKWNRTFNDHFARRIQKEEEAVNLITGDLITNAVFKKTPGREGYASFPKFEQSLLHGLDYRDLHKWLKEPINLRGSMYQLQK